MTTWGLTIMNDDKFFLAALDTASGLGKKSIARLVEFFGSAQDVWNADIAELSRVGVRKNSLDALVNFRAYNPDAPKTIADFCDRQKIGVCSFFDDDYPPLLKDVDSPPMFFYYRGHLQPDALRIAIVGSRQNTAYGQEVAFDFAEKLAAAGLTVVSGAARGIDTFAHRGAIKAGRTVAVLGCGLACKLPRERALLLDQVADSGVIISEFALHVTPTQGTLVARNRIIAGLAQGIIVVEAGLKSGALIAANCAADYGRAVFAVPGSIHSDVSAGCNNLIRGGAIPISSPHDVITEVFHE